MQLDEIRKMDELEEHLWWFVTLRRLVVEQLEKWSPKPAQDTRILDAGCGTGGMLGLLNGKGYNKLHGIEISNDAISFARGKSNADIKQASVESLPYSDNEMDVVICLDVLEYDLDPDKALCEIYRVLKPGGITLINVPAYKWMMSYHDRSVGQVTRYSKKEILEKIDRCGLASIMSTYWNFFLFPLMVLRRKILKSVSGSDVKPLPSIINTIISKLLNLEISLIRLGIPLPFGGSVFIIAKKDA